MSNNNTNLTDYILERAYSKDESYTKSDVDSLIQAINEKEVDIFELVLELPSADNVKSNKLYLKYNGDNDEGNLFDVFLFVNGEWEQLDGLDFKITDYYNTNQIDDLLQTKASNRQLTTVRENLETVRGNLTNLYTNLTGFNEALIALDDDNTNLSDDLTKLKDNLLIFIARVDGLIDGLQTLQGNFNGLTHDFEETKSDLTLFQEELTGEDGLGGSLGSLRSELQETQSNLTTVQGDVDTAKNDISALQGSSDELTSQLGGLSLSLETTNGSLGSTNALLGSLREEFNILNSDFTDAVGVLETARDDIEGLQDSTQTLTGGLSDLSDSLDNTKSSLATANSGLQNLHNELLGEDGNTGLKKNLNDLSATVGTVQTDITSLREADTVLQGNINTLSTDLNGDSENTGLKDELFSLQESLYGDENDDTKNGIVGDIHKLQSDTGVMSINLAKLWEGLTDATGELVVTGEDVIIFSQELDQFLSDLNVLGGHLSNFEGSLTEFKSELSDDGVSFETFSLDSNIVSLFASIGAVKSNITGLQDRADIIEEDINGVNTALYGSSDGDSENYTDGSLFGTIDNVQGNITEITETTIPSVESSINTVDSRVTTTNTKIDKITNETIPSVENSISAVDDKIEGVNTVIGDEDSGLIKDLSDTNARITGVEGTIGDEDGGLIKDINTARNDIDSTANRVTYVEETIGDENSGLTQLLNTTHSDLENAKTTIGDENTGLIHELNVVDAKVDNTTNQLNQSIQYINNVQKIVYGDNTYYYTCNETEWKTYTIDTVNITGEQFVKFIVYPVNDIFLKDITVVDNGDFNYEFNSWSITDFVSMDNDSIELSVDTDDTVMCNLRSNVQVMILSQEQVDLTGVDELSFSVKANDDSNPLTDVINGLFVYIGEEEQNQGLLDTLSNFTSRLSSFDKNLKDLDDDLTVAKDDITDVKETIGDENSGIIKDILNIGDEDSGLIKQINTRIDGTVRSIEETNTTIESVEGSVGEVQGILYGEDKEHPSDNTVLKNIDNVQTGIGSVQSDISDINSTIGDNNSGLIKDINTAQTNINRANNSISDLETELYIGETDGTTTDPAENTVMRNILDINLVNDLIKRAIDNLFTPPSKFNEDVVHIYIPITANTGTPANSQELMIMESDFNFPISKTNYIYQYNKNWSQGRLYKRNSSGWSEITNVNYSSEFGDNDVLFVCYELASSQLTGEIKNAGLIPLMIEYVYEIKTQKYYKLTMV